MESLVHSFFSDHDRLNEKDSRELSRWVAADAANADTLVELLCIESDIRQVLRIAQTQDAMGLTRRRETLVPRAPARASWYQRGLALAVACSLLLTAVGYLWTRPQQQVGGEAANRGEVATTFAATLSEMRNCVWETPKADFDSGHLFKVGSDLNLASGVVQMCFETGAVALVEGPAQFTLRENAMDLARGRVSAVVPKSATGFAVYTPTSEVIDLGTEFGVSVDNTGASQVHVFSGEVATRPRNAAGQAVGEPLFVTTNNAIRFGPDSVQHQRLVADEEAFERELAGLGSSSAEIEPPVDKPLLLWLSSDNWIVDDQQRVAVWRDIVCNVNHVPDNALQAAPEFRPTVVENAFNSHPVARFDGTDDFLVTTPFHSGDNQTVVFVACVNAVFKPTSFDYRAAPQIINYNGPPQVDANWISAPNYPEILATAYDSKRIAIDSFVYVGFRGRDPEKPNSQVFVGEIATERPIPGRFHVDELPGVGEPFIGMYVYDMDNKRAELWINGQSAGWTSAPSPIAVTSRKVIGRHGGYPRNFNGDIAEVMIYDQGLDAGEVATLTNTLAVKYGIVLPE